MMLDSYKRLIMMGDGIIYYNNNKFYTTGVDRSDFYQCFQMIDEVILWGRIYDITDREVKDLTEICLNCDGKIVSVEGVWNQSPGIFGYINTLPKRLFKLKEIYLKPAIVFGSLISPSGILTWLFFKKKSLIFISRLLGDIDVLLEMKKFRFSTLIVKFQKFIFNKTLKGSILQTWVSKALEEKYRFKEIPSIVYNDNAIHDFQLATTPNVRKTQELELIFIGRLSPEKGIIDLLSALDGLNFLYINLTIVGQGSLENEIKHYIESHNMNNVVSIVGYKKWGGDLFNLMKNSHCLIVPSKSEGLPSVILEAMSNAIPVIGTNVGGIPEIVQHNVNGLIFCPGDVNALRKSIESIYYDEKFRQKLIVGAIETAKLNTREMQLAKFQDALDEVMKL